MNFYDVVWRIWHKLYMKYYKNIEFLKEARVERIFIRNFYYLAHYIFVPDNVVNISRRSRNVGNLSLKMKLWKDEHAINDE